MYVYTHIHLLSVLTSAVIFHLYHKFTKEGQERDPRERWGRCWDISQRPVPFWRGSDHLEICPHWRGTPWRAWVFLQRKMCLKDWSLPRRDKLTSRTGRDLLEASVCHLHGPWGLHAGPLEEEEEAGAIPRVEVFPFHSLQPLSPLSDLGLRAGDWSR